MADTRDRAGGWAQGGPWGPGNGAGGGQYRGGHYNRGAAGRHYREEFAEPPPPAGRSGRRRADASHWHWLLLIPISVPLMVPLYNRIHPAFFGLPFYYWAQLAFAGLSAVVVAIVHMATKRR